MEEEEDESIPPSSAVGTSTSIKYLVNSIVKDVLQEFVNLTKHMISSSQQAKSLAIQNKNSLRKFQSRVEILLKYLKSLEDDQMMSDHEEEDFFGIEEDGSDV
ncbi:uncharacterized protein DS421_11g337760 [Arachis hypogaea]|nr:uncharacterized protein DS421_11g337760 [Arachis hypogaea]